MTTHLRTCSVWVGLLTWIVMGAQGVSAQSVRISSGDSSAEAQAPPPPPPPPTSSVDRDVLQDLYRDLYEVQLRIAREPSGGSVVDSLTVVRGKLLVQIEELARRVEKARARRGIPRPPSVRGGDDLSVLLGEVENLDTAVDWDAIAKQFEGQAGSLGEGLALLGEHLKHLQVDVDSERVQVDTGTGSRFTFTIPPEVKRDIGEGIREMSRELGRVLDDSTRQAFGTDFRLLLDELPGEVFGRSGRKGLRPREKKVIAESVFQVWKDFEVGDDEVVRGDMVLIGGDAYVAGEVQGNVYVLFGDLFVEGNGNVAADAVSLGGRVQVDDESEVHGRRFDVSSVLPGFGLGVWNGSSGGSWLRYSVRVAILALLLVFVYALAGQRIGVIVEQGERRVGRSLFAGTLWFSATLGVFVVAAVGLVISVIGIPVVIVIAAAFVIVVLLAYFAGCQLVGGRLLDLLGGNAPGREWQVALIGLALLEIPALVGTLFSGAGLPTELAMMLTVLDFFVKFLVLGIGFGAVVETRLGGPRHPLSTAGSEITPLASDV